MVLLGSALGLGALFLSAAIASIQPVPLLHSNELLSHYKTVHIAPASRTLKICSSEYRSCAAILRETGQRLNPLSGHWLVANKLASFP
jgi:hypothetical protein